MSNVADALRALKVPAQEIAEKSRLPIERIREILDGNQVALSELRAIAAGLRLPMHVLAKGERPSDKSTIAPLFRAVRGAHQDYDVTIEKIATFVEASVEILPKRGSLPAWLQGLDAKETSYEEADRLAKQFRELVFDNPSDDPASGLPADLGSLEGVIVSRLLYSRYEGVSLIAGNYCFIFVSPRFPGRMLFTLGHELGHVIAHHKKGGEALFEKPGEIGTFGANSRQEAMVDAFASCLLLPDQGVAKALKMFKAHYQIEVPAISDFEILLLARFFGVSFDVAARRCEDLELIPRGTAFVLSGKLKKEFGSAEKRADQLGVPARAPIAMPALSRHLSAAVSRVVEGGNVSIGWITDRLGLSIAEVLAANRGRVSH